MSVNKIWIQNYSYTCRTNQKNHKIAFSWLVVHRAHDYHELILMESMQFFFNKHLAKFFQRRHSVISHIPLLFGSTYDVTSYLQRIQNYAAREILRIPNSANITTHLKPLHWLPVKERSTYKIACLSYHCHSSTAPSYVADMLQTKQSHSHSSSHTIPLLNRPAHSKATLDDRSFYIASSSVRNCIPNYVKCAPSLSSFESRLKTYLFRSVNKDWTFSLITVFMCMAWPCYFFDSHS